MLKLFHAECIKLYKSKSFFFCCLGGILMSGILVATVKAMEGMYSSGMLSAMDKMAMDSAVLSLQEVDALTILKQIFTSNTIQILTAIFTSIFVCMEYASGAMKNIASKGFSRLRIYAVKYAIILIAAELIAILVVVIISFFSGILWGFDTIFQNMSVYMHFVGINLVINLGITGVYIMVATISRNMGIAIAINVGLMSFIGLILQGIDLITNNKLGISKYWIMQMVTDVANLALTPNVVIRCLVTVAIYLIFTFIAGVCYFNKKDI